MSAPLSFHYIREPHALMRMAPQDDATVVSDALYSEEVDLLEDAAGWSKIRTKIDGYSGWVNQVAVCHLSKEQFQGERLAKVSQLQALIYSIADTEKGPILTLPFGSRIRIIEEPEAYNRRWIKVALVDGREAFVQRGDVTTEPAKTLSKREMVLFSHAFLKVPYVWGGRSSFGLDCSGFVQLLYREMGVFLPRDCKDQCSWKGFRSVKMDELESGDLIFFGPAADKIRHVGMYLDNQRFIHAVIREQQPNVHISSLEDRDWNGSNSSDLNGFSPLVFRTARRLKTATEPAKSSTLKPALFVGVACAALNIAFRLLKQ